MVDWSGGQAEGLPPASSFAVCRFRVAALLVASRVPDASWLLLACALAVSLLNSLFAASSCVDVAARSSMLNVTSGCRPGDSALPVALTPQ